MPDLISVLGGRAAVGLVVEDLYRRIGDDPLLAPVFAGYDVYAIQRHLHEFLLAAVGDDRAMTGRPLDLAHAGLGVTDEMFDAVAAHLVAALRDQGVAAEHVDAVVAVVEPTRSSVVTRTATPPGTPEPSTSGPSSSAARAAAAAQGFAQHLHLTSVVHCWRAFATAHGGEVVVDPTFIACRVPRQPALDRSIVLDAGAVDPVLQLYGEAAPELWTRDRDEVSAGKLAAAGFGRGRRTTAMASRLHELGRPLGGVPIRKDADPGLVAALSGSDPEVVRGVAGVTSYLSADGASGLLLYRSGTDAVVAYLATDPASRRQGLATSVLRAALVDVRERGVRTASLQASPLAAGVCDQLGFVPIGGWQQWVRRG